MDESDDVNVIINQIVNDLKEQRASNYPRKEVKRSSYDIDTYRKEIEELRRKSSIVDQVMDELSEQRKTLGVGIDGSEDIIIWGAIQTWLEDGNPAHIDSIVVHLNMRGVLPTPTVFNCIAKVAVQRLFDKKITGKKFHTDKAKQKVFVFMARIEAFCSQLPDVNISQIGNWGAAFYDQKFGSIGYEPLKSSTLQKLYANWKHEHKSFFDDLVEMGKDLSSDEAISLIEPLKELKVKEQLIGNRRD